MPPTENLDNKIEKFWPKNGPPTQEIEKYVKKYKKEKNSYQMWWSHPSGSRAI